MIGRDDKPPENYSHRESALITVKKLIERSKIRVEALTGLVNLIESLPENSPTEELLWRLLIESKHTNY